jgi:excisionase family DNA binding protein
MTPLEKAAREKWLTPSQAARELGLSVQRVRQLIDAGSLDCERTVLGRLIDPASVKRLAAERAK